MSFLAKIFRFFPRPAKVDKLLESREVSNLIRDGLPPTFGPVPGPSESEEKLIFDPALKHFRRALRRGDPELPEELMKVWQAGRRQAMMHLLSIVAVGPWGQSVILRGSLALKAVLGEAAREPGDMDWIVRPESLRMDEPQARKMFNSISQTVATNSKSGAVHFDVDGIASNEIWTYDRAPGYRIAFPWQTGDLPPGVIQMDFVFEQKLHRPGKELAIKMGEHPEVTVICASEEESLAWKLLWLWSDMWPQGKDLYDAVLLAERYPLSSVLLETVFSDAGDAIKPINFEGFPFSSNYTGEADWENFLKECPWVTGYEADWRARLIEAVKPTMRELKDRKNQSA